MKKTEQQRLAQELIDRHGAQAAKEIAAEIYALCFRFMPEKPLPSLPTKTKTEAQKLAAMMLRAGVELVTPMQPRRTVAQRLSSLGSSVRR